MKPHTDMHGCNGENKHRMVALLTLCPWLQKGTGKTLLYVGAMPTRQDFLAELIGWGWTVEILEVWEPYRAFLETIEGVRAVHIGDVRTCQPGVYDSVFWFHGPEHLPKDDVPTALQNCEDMARHAVVIGMPFGDTGSGATEGNHYNEHKSAWQGPDLEPFGYRWMVTHVGYRNITAVKMLGNKTPA